MEIAAILEGREPPSEAAMMRVLTPAEQRAQTAMSLQEVTLRAPLDWPILYYSLFLKCLSSVVKCRILLSRYYHEIAILM